MKYFIRKFPKYLYAENVKISIIYKIYWGFIQPLYGFDRVVRFVVETT